MSHSSASIWFLLLSASFSLVQAQIKLDLGFDLDLEDTIGPVIQSLVGQKPDNENGTNSRFRDRALHDKSNEEIYDNSTQVIIERSGYKQKTFEVLSDDGYITQLINIINPLVDREHLKRPPVVMLHGGFLDSSSWVFANSIQHYPEKYPRNLTDGPITSYNRSLGFVLANNGFDVWLVSNRGSNNQNLGHTNYKTKLLEDLLESIISGQESVESIAREFIDNIRYFDYSLDDRAEYEAPRQIEAVLHLTGSKRVSVISYSFNTMIMFQFLTSDGALTNRIHSFVAMNPVLNLNGTNLIIKTLSVLFRIVPQSIGTLIAQVVLSRPTRAILRRLNRYGIFKLIISLLFGSSAKYTSFFEEPFLGHALLPVAFKELMHVNQILQAGQLQKFDYGPAKNVLAYGSFTPPVYDLSKFKVKRWMVIKNLNDNVGSPDSTDEYVRQIGVKPYKIVENIGYNHIDSIIGFENDIKVNLPILEFLDRFKVIRPNKPVHDHNDPMEYRPTY